MKYLPIGGEVIIVPFSVSKSGALLTFGFSGAWSTSGFLFRGNGDNDPPFDSDTSSVPDCSDCCLTSSGGGVRVSLSLPFDELSIDLGDSLPWNFLP